MLMSVATLRTPTGWSPSDPFVLLVDDHVEGLERLRALVEVMGHRCVTAGSAAEAIDYCDLRRPDLVVTDLSMPRLDGRGLATWMKARHPTTPIVLMTAECLDATTIDALRRTFNDVLSKPLDVENFLKVLEDFVPRRNGQRPPGPCP